MDCNCGRSSKLKYQHSHWSYIHQFQWIPMIHNSKCGMILIQRLPTNSFSVCKWIFSDFDRFQSIQSIIFECLNWFKQSLPTSIDRSHSNRFRSNTFKSLQQFDEIVKLLTYKHILYKLAELVIVIGQESKWIWGAWGWRQVLGIIDIRILRQ